MCALRTALDSAHTARYQHLAILLLVRQVPVSQDLPNLRRSAEAPLALSRRRHWLLTHVVPSNRQGLG